MYKFKQKNLSSNLKMLASGEKAREKKKIVEMHEIGTDSRRDEFPDNIQLIHSSM